MRRRREERRNQPEKDMRALAIILSLAAYTAAGNSLPPTPEAPAVVQG